MFTPASADAEFTTSAPSQVFSERPDIDLVVFSKKSCPQCTATYRLGNKEGVGFVAVNADALEEVDGEPESVTKELADLRAAYAAIRAENPHILQAPIVVARDGRVWGGFNPDKVKSTNQLVGQLVSAAA